MYLPKALRYRAAVRWDGESGGDISCKKTVDFRVDMPIEFSGEGRYPCPDQVFLASIGGCLLTTFLHFKRRLGLEVEDIRISVEEEIALVGAEGYRIRWVEAVLHVKGERGGGGLVRRCAELARDYCHITKTIEKALPIRVHVEVEEEEVETKGKG